MTFRLALRRLLPLLAVISLALTPVTAPAATAGMHASMARIHPVMAVGDDGTHAMMGGPEAASDKMAGMAQSGEVAGMAMDDMPCCPKAEAAKPDCAKACPWMALCLASVVVSLPPVAVVVPVPAATRASLSWPEATASSSRHAPPLPEPPRA